MTSTFEKYLPYSGILAGLLFAIGGWLPAVADEAGDPAALTLLHDNAAQNLAAAALLVLFCGVMTFFAAALRRSLRSGEGGEATYSAVAYAGAVLLAGSQATAGWLLFAGVSAAGKGDEEAVRTLSHLSTTGWVVWLAPAAAMLLAVGLGGLRNAVLPRWLAVVTLVLGALCLTGVGGFAAFLVMPLWLAVTGVVLGRRQNRLGGDLPLGGRLATTV